MIVERPDGYASRMSNVVMDAAAERLSGDRPGRWRAIVAAIVAGVAVAALVYRLLRSDPDPEPEPDPESD